MFDAVDLYAGGGGWGVACRVLGVSEVGIEIDTAACDTRYAAGLETVQADVRDCDPLDEQFAGAGLIASPPCQSFSTAGRGDGRAALTKICSRVERGVWDDDGLPSGAGLIMDPVRWIMARYVVDRPYKWICFEQVPPCLPVWESFARMLRALDYRVVTGNLQAECYGVPQTRKRAVLIARLEGEVALPAPTHSRYYSRDPGRLDAGVLPWVSMADALGWGDEFVQVSNYSSESHPGIKNERRSDQPSSTVTSKINRSRWQLADRRRPKAAFPRALGLPAITVTSSWDNGDIAWVTERPATTVNADPRISKPGRHDPNDSGSQQRGAIRVTPQEAAILQSFPADYPWQGTKTQTYQQIGNACPALLAEAVLREVVTRWQPAHIERSNETDGPSAAIA